MNRGGDLEDGPTIDHADDRTAERRYGTLRVRKILS